VYNIAEDNTAKHNVLQNVRKTYITKKTSKGTYNHPQNTKLKKIHRNITLNKALRNLNYFYYFLIFLILKTKSVSKIVDIAILDNRLKQLRLLTYLRS
jgi:hypothetical protein